MKAFKHDRKAISALLAVALIAIIIVSAVATYWLGTQILGVSPPREEEEIGYFYGALTLVVEEANTLDPATAPTTTSDVYKIYHSRGNSLADVDEDFFVAGKTYTVGTGADFDVAIEDNGTIFWYADPGTDYFLDATETASDNNNDGITDTRTMDVDGDNREEYVFEVDVSDYNADPKPTKTLIACVVQEDTSIATNSPDDQDSIGTGTKTGTIEWQISGISEKYGGRLARVYITSNDTTFESQTAVTGVSIAGIPGSPFTGGDITPDSGASTWYIDIGVNDYRELVDTLLVTRPTGGTSYVAVTVSWETYFAAASDATTLTLYVTMMGADESCDSADSDDVILGG